MVVKHINEFKEFLKEYKVVGLAIGIIMGLASTALVKSIVDNIIMPIISPLLPAGGWREATFILGQVTIGWGAFLAELINFLIIAWVVFMVAKYLIREEKVTKK